MTWYEWQDATQAQTHSMKQLHVNVEDTEQEHSHEGHISHRAVIKLAFMDVFANFCVTVGFSIIGSGVMYGNRQMFVANSQQMYQVIYSSVVIWCAVLTFLFMNRKLSILQWIAIFGTSAGLAMSSLDSMKGSDDASEEGQFIFNVYNQGLCIFSKKWIIDVWNPDDTEWHILLL